MTLLSQAIAIRDANTIDENTATRVGDWMVDAVGEIDSAQETADEATVLATVGLRDAITGDFYAKTLADFYLAVDDDGTEGKANAAGIQQLVLNTSGLSATGLSGDSANLVVGIANTTSGAVQKITGASLLAPALAAAAAADAVADQAVLDAAQAQATADEALAAANAIDTSTFVTLDTAQTIEAVKTFDAQPVFNTDSAPVSGSAVTALLINDSGGVVQRELGSQAFASASDFVPTARTITIDAVTQDLTANRTWDLSATYLTIVNAASTYTPISGFKHFSAYLSANQAVGAGAGYEPVLFDEEVYDVGSVFNDETSVITVPAGELWRIDVTVDTNHTEVLLIRLYNVTGASSVQQARLGVVGSTTTGIASFTTGVVAVSTQFRVEIAQAGGAYNLLGGTAPALCYIAGQRVNR